MADTDALEQGYSKRSTQKFLPIIAVLVVTLLTFTTIFTALAAFKSKDSVNLVVNSPTNGGAGNSSGNNGVISVNVSVPVSVKTRIDGNNGGRGRSVDTICYTMEDKQKFDCHPELGVTETRCLERGCCWKQPQFIDPKIPTNTIYAPVGLPSCFYPEKFSGYEVVSSSNTQSGLLAILRRKSKSGFPLDIEEVQLKVSFLDENKLNIKITDPNAVRYEVPFPTIRTPTKGRQGSEEYDVSLDQNARLVVTRKETGTKIFDANLSTMIYADQLLQINIKTPFDGFYGIGESKDGLFRGHDWKRYVLFNRDRGPAEDLNLYGAHPFYLQMENDGRSHGVFLFNSNAMDVVAQPTPAITFRPIGGIFDFYIFLGPSPADVIKQYQEVIGKPIMPPYWSLGFQLCRWGYGSAANTRAIWQKTRDAGIPFDVQWNDIDYMDDYNDFTVGKANFSDLSALVKDIHAAGMRYVMIMDVGIGGADAPDYPPYTDAVDMDVLVKNSTGDILVGQVWNKGVTVFPDYSHPRAGEYMTKQYQYLYDQIQFDGAWIDMNEPSNFVDGSNLGCPDTRFENPPYVPGSLEPLRTKTICMSSIQHASTHYNLHNIHGFTNAIATNIALGNVLKNQRQFIISRSTAPGQGFYSGHWDGDISSTWDNLRYTIPSILNFGLYGFSMMGADICGFTGNTTPQLCARWQALGAFYPFSRNHNVEGAIDQDPASLGPDVLAATKNALTIRYTLLPYLYTLFYQSHVDGTTVARALFFEFPKDPKTYKVETTFLWGSALLIIPVLEENATSVTAYIPDDVWYDYSTEKQLEKVNTDVTFDTPIDKINLLVRGGFILPTQEPAVTTTLSRKNPFGLRVALKDGIAEGQLYWDNGVDRDVIQFKKMNYIEFNVKDKKLTSTPMEKGYTEEKMILDSIKVYGVKDKVTGVKLNDKDVKTFTYNDDKKVLDVTGLKQDPLLDFTVSWS